MNELVRGLMVVIGIAVATGHYSELERWSRKQAIEALVWKQSPPYFFPKGYEMTHSRMLAKVKQQSHATRFPGILRFPVPSVNNVINEVPSNENGQSSFHLPASGYDRGSPGDR